MVMARSSRSALSTGFVVFDEFLREMSGLDIEDLFSAIPTQTVSLDATDVFYGRRARSTVGNNLAVRLVCAKRTHWSVAIAEHAGHASVIHGGAIRSCGVGRWFTAVRRFSLTPGKFRSTMPTRCSCYRLYRLTPMTSPVSSTGFLIWRYRRMIRQPLRPRFNYIGTGVDDVAVFVNDLQLAGRFRNAPGGNSSAGERLFFSEDGARIHSYFQPFPANTGAYDMVVDATGVTEAFTNRRFGSDLALAEGSPFLDDPRSLTTKPT